LLGEKDPVFTHRPCYDEPGGELGRSDEISNRENPRVKKQNGHFDHRQTGRPKELHDDQEL
jgi:hypothetical protein